MTRMRYECTLPKSMMRIIKWYSEGVLLRAEIQKFLSMLAGEVLNGPNLYRGIKVIGKPDDLEQTYDKTINFFVYLDKHLGDRDYLLGTKHSRHCLVYVPKTGCKSGC
ncbi:hypothetical protein L1077_18355 [Pseudoalteromonas luteoviolacea]|uniref:hypothetical protein n=1 Tax=Pseudoalteromonas luteoviolacea TaxID=43657 RepID=UPI001F2833C6|nr:hypothetical protein [Pseudoalteromonas luteoviolacea]MCF6441402.1 hypothetical protein [Pseudoalteromonas luteoviolacea]